MKKLSNKNRQTIDQEHKEAFLSNLEKTIEEMFAMIGEPLTSRMRRGYVLTAEEFVLRTFHAAEMPDSHHVETLKILSNLGMLTKTLTPNGKQQYTHNTKFGERFLHDNATGEMIRLGENETLPNDFMTTSTVYYGNRIEAVSTKTVYALKKH